MKYIKPIAIAALFIIGAVEMLFPFSIAFMFYAFSPQTRRVFAATARISFISSFTLRFMQKVRLHFIWGLRRL